MVTHLLMTRFAVDFQRIPLTPSWFRKRFDLFERYCVPSVKAQTLTDFRWLIYISSKFAREYASRLAGYDGRIEVRTDDHKAALDAIGDVVVTTRLDSDDAIAATVLEQAHWLAPSVSEPTLVNFLTGYHVHDKRQRAYVGRGAAFKSLIEPAGSRVGVYVRNCDEIADVFPSVVVREPSWLRVVHGGNLVNRFNFGFKSVPLVSVRDQGFPWLA